MNEIDKIFEHTATGVLGDKRETMLHNDLLQRVQKLHVLFQLCNENVRNC